MKLIFIIFFFLQQFITVAQTEEEKIKLFLDSLKMGGSYLVGKTLPAFEIKSLQGNSFTNESLKNKITFINFWFEACAPCIAEMNTLENLYQNFKTKTDFQFLSITFEKKEAIEKLSEKHKMTYPVFSTTIDSCHYLNFKKGFPTTIIINDNSKIEFFIHGGFTNPEDAERYFNVNIYPVLNRLLKKD